MPLVTAIPKSMTNGTIVTQFINSTNSEETTYTYPFEQNSLLVENSGIEGLYVSVGIHKDVFVAADTAWSIEVPFISFSIRSEIPSQEFIATSVVNKTTESILEAKISKEQLSANSIILIGDSITAQHIHTVGNMWGYSARGFFTWANSLLRQRFDILAIKGVGGQRTDQILSRIYTDVVNHNPKPNWCLVNGGVNDIGQNRSFESITSNLLQMYTILNENGIKVIATTITPNNNSNEAQLKTTANVNRWIKRYCQKNNGVVLCDWSGALTNPSTGKPSDRIMVADGIHPSIYGASVMGKSLYESLKDVVPEIDILTHSNFEDNLLDNPLMVGNSDGMATGWNLYRTSAEGTVIPSKVSRSGLTQGEWQQFKLIAGEFSFGKDFNVTETSARPGDVVYAQCEFETDEEGWENFTRLALQIEFRGTNSSTGCLVSSSSDQVPFLRPGNGVLKTPEIAIPANTTRVLLYGQLKGTGTIRFGKIQLSKV